MLKKQAQTTVVISFPQYTFFIFLVYKLPKKWPLSPMVIGFALYTFLLPKQKAY